MRTRESSDATLTKFVNTKKSNHIDYADAFIRYLRATQFISFDKKTYRMIIASSRAPEVDYILKNIDPKAKKYKTEDEYKTYLFNPDSLLLLTDDREYLEKQLAKLSVRFTTSSSIDSLKDLLEAAEKRVISGIISETEVSLKNYKEFNDIVEVFRKIQKKEVPDPPLYLEWNIWRAMIMINYTKNIQGNFKL